MTDREIWQQRAKAERGMVLAMLYNALLPTVDYMTIRGCLDQVGMPTESEVLNRHLIHLQERGYIVAHVGHAIGVTLRSYALTPNGRDLIIGAIKDPGVVVPDFDQS